MFKTESGNKTTCSDLVTDSSLNCTQSDTFSHCRKSCNGPFCCADSIASFEIMLPHMAKPRYRNCNYQPLKNECDKPDVFNTCPVRCGKCNPTSVLLGMIEEQGEVVEGFEIKVMEQAIMIKDQSDLINRLKNKATEHTMRFEDQDKSIKHQGDLITGLQNDVTEQERNIQDNGGKIVDLEAEVYGYGYFDNYVYKPAEVLLTWEEHEAAAVAWGGHIVSIHSHAELDFILSLTGKEYKIYIGMKRDGEGNFKYIDGTPFDFTNWATGEPNGGDYENVGVIGPDGLYRDYADHNEFFSMYRKIRVP